MSADQPIQEDALVEDDPATLFTYIVQSNKIKSNPKYVDASELWDALCVFTFFWDLHNQVYSKEVMLAIGDIYTEMKRITEN